MKQKTWIVIGIAIIFLIVVGVLTNYYFFKPSSFDFELDSIFLKIVLTDGGTTNNNIKITNTNSASEHFKVSVGELGDMVK